MKKLKTLVVAILCFVFIFALCACQDPAGGGNGGNNAQTEEQKIAHIDELTSQQVTEEVWKKAVQTYQTESFTASVYTTTYGDYSLEPRAMKELTKVQSVNGHDNMMADRGGNGDLAFQYLMYENDSYWLYYFSEDMTLLEKQRYMVELDVDYEFPFGR